MAVKDMFIEIVKQCRIKTKDGMKECGVGSVVLMPENEAKYVLGLGKAKASKGPEKIVSVEKPKPESKAGESKKAEK